MSDQSNSITLLFDQLRAGDKEAASKLWDRFFERLVSYARSRMSNVNRRVTDEEDIAMSVMQSLCSCADRGKLPKIDSRDDLWRLLLCWTRHNIADQVRANRRQKRGAGNTRGDSVFDPNGAGFDQICDQSLVPADVLIDMEEQCESLLRELPSENLRTIAKFRMEGYSNGEIAKMLDVSDRTIERKLNLIRQAWTPKQRPTNEN